MPLVRLILVLLVMEVSFLGRFALCGWYNADTVVP